MEKGFFGAVYRVVRQIPKGKVTTYGIVARLAGNPRMSRQVGWALHANPDQSTIPCHRVVNRYGALAPSFAFGGKEIQKLMLEQEGVSVREDGTIDLQRHLWEG